MPTPQPSIPDNAPSTARKLLTAKELASDLGVSVSLIQRLSAQGRIPRYKLGRRTIRYKADDVLAAMLSGGARTRGPSSGTPPAPASLPPRHAPPEPINDLPPYDWSSEPGSRGTIPAAVRRG